MSASDILLNLFLADDGSPEQEAAAEEAESLSSEEILDAMPEVADQLPPDQAAVVRAAYGLEQPEGAPEVPAEIAEQIPPLPEDASAAEVMAHYNTVIDMTHDDGDVYVDQSVHQNIEAFGDVNQSFEQSAVTGDDAVLAGDDAQINTGDGAVQVGGDVSDSTVGQGNTNVEDSVMNESSLTGDVSSDDTSVSASGGSTLAFGEGSNASIDDSDTEVGENYGNFAGEGDLSSDVDNSLNDSFNTEGSFGESNIFEDNSSSSVFESEGSLNTDNSFTDGSSDDDWTSTSDDDTTYEDNSTTSDSSSYDSSYSSDDDTTYEDNSTSSDSTSYDESYSSDDDASFEDSSTSEFDLFGGGS
jgi:hypothetical protein